MIRIEKASEAQLSLVREIAYQTWPHTFGNILSPEQIAFMLGWMYSPESLLAQVREKKHHFLLAWEDSHALGFASYELDYKGEPITKIHKLYVLPHTQSKGIGKALIQQIAQAAWAQNNQALSLNVNRNNPAVHFYQHIGFIVAGQEDIDIGNGFLMEDFIMQKKL